MNDAERQQLLDMLTKLKNWPSSSIIPASFQMSQIIKIVDAMLAERTKYT